MTAVRVAGVAPCVGLRNSQAAPLLVVAEAVNCIGVVPLSRVIGCCETGEALDTVSLTVMEVGLTVSDVAARTVRVTGTTTGLFEAEEVIVIEPL